LIGRAWEGHKSGTQFVVFGRLVAAIAVYHKDKTMGGSIGRFGFDSCGGFTEVDQQDAPVPVVTQQYMGCWMPFIGPPPSFLKSETCDMRGYSRVHLSRWAYDTFPPLAHTSLRNVWTRVQSIASGLRETIAS